MKPSIETDIAVIRVRLEQLVEGQERLAAANDVLRSRVDEHSKRLRSADDRSRADLVSTSPGATRRVQLLIGAGSAGAGVTLGALLEKLLALLF